MLAFPFRAYLFFTTAGERKLCVTEALSRGLPGLTPRFLQCEQQVNLSRFAAENVPSYLIIFSEKNKSKLLLDIYLLKMKTPRDSQRKQD